MYFRGIPEGEAKAFPSFVYPEAILRLSAGNEVLVGMLPMDRDRLLRIRSGYRKPWVSRLY
jgi:hypothetical protein